MLLRTLATCLLIAAAGHSQPLPGTEPLQLNGDFAVRMLDGIDRYLDRATAAAAEARRSRELQEGSRNRLRKLVGAIDPRVPLRDLSLDAVLGRPAEIAATARYTVWAVRWPVVEGVEAEGLLLQPRGTPRARVVALPDAGWTPEMVVGLDPGVPTEAQYARRLAESGFQVLVPALIDNAPVGVADVRVGRYTNQPRREFLYRMAFEVGRHVIGYEVQTVSAAIDWLAARAPRSPIGLFGYGEGGLIALFSAALDTRVDATTVSGYFQPREGLWREPVYRNVWGLLTEFGDAELASLISPRGLVVETARAPEFVLPLPPSGGRNDAAPGHLHAHSAAAVRQEWMRARVAFERQQAGERTVFVDSGAAQGHPGSREALNAFARILGARNQLSGTLGMPPRRLRDTDAHARQKRVFERWMAFTQSAVRSSEFTRRRFWSNANTSSLDAWDRSKQFYRQHLWEEVLGKLPAPSETAPVRTRLIYGRKGWKGYEVLLPAWPDVFAYGYLLVPTGVRAGERRPVVVCQHGRGGRPVNLVDPPNEGSARAYKRVAVQLAERGFIVYVPQNPYIFEERYRLIQRKANPLKLSLFSFILGQHQRTLEWLSSLPFVDGKRIGFYGLSYGGKTAVRVPPLLDGYALAICSGDFNEYAGKMAGIDRSESFLYTDEYEMYEFDLANTFNYSELAALMAPRPFMVERGHRDGIAFDHWVAYEYAKVLRFYTFLGLAHRTEIELFDGVHELHCEGTFRFLHRHLGWPEPDDAIGRVKP